MCMDRWSNYRQTLLFELLFSYAFQFVRISLLLRFPHMCSGVWNMVFIMMCTTCFGSMQLLLVPVHRGNFRHLKSTHFHAYIQIYCSLFALYLTTRKRNIFTHRCWLWATLIVLVYWNMLNAWLASAGS